MLSRREAEVASLVALGMTNREIAQQLFLSERTVEGHVQQILNKLGFSSRSQIAAWHVTQGAVPSPRPSVTVVSPAHPGRTVRWQLPAAAAVLAIVVAGSLARVALSPQLGTPTTQSVRVVATGIVPSRGDGCVAADSDGTLFLPSDVAGAIYVVKSQGTVESLQPSITWPLGVTFDPAGDLFASRTRAEEGIVRLRKGSGNWESLVFSRRFGDGSEFGRVNCLAFDARGNLFASSSPKHAIWRIADDQVTLFAGTGRAGYAGDRGLATHAELHAPVGMVTDRVGNLYIADSLNNCIRRVDPVSGVITTFAGTGAVGSSGDGGPAADARMYFPSGLAFDPEGSLWISDTENNRIRKVDMKSGRISTAIGSGRYGTSIEGRAMKEIELAGPTGIAFDPHGNLFIVDSYNNRVLKVFGASRGKP